MYIGAAYYPKQLSIMLSKYGIKTFLASPTSAIPYWMYDKNQNIMQITAAGENKPYGKRRFVIGYN